MWILEAVTLAVALASGLESRAAGGSDRFISYVHTQQVPEPRIWLDRGDDPVLETGDRVRIFYRTEVDAYVVILQIDTDGTTRMLYPRSSTENHYARAGRDYRLLFPRSAYWNVDDRPGVGYFFVVTSPVPLDFRTSGTRFTTEDGIFPLSGVLCTRIHTSPWTITWPDSCPIGNTWTTGWISSPTMWGAFMSIPGSCVISATVSVHTAPGIPMGILAWISGWSSTMTPTSIPPSGTAGIVS